MARSIWIGALVATLACTAPGWAQVQSQERVVTIREADRPAQKCRVLKCWKLKDGGKACQVQAIDTGEMLTIVEPAAARQVAAGGTTGKVSRIFHWGNKNTPPKDAPVAPPDAVVLGKPANERPAERSLLSKWFGGKETPAATHEAPCQECATRKETTVAQTRTEAPPTVDWRLSWGKVDRWTDDDSKRAVAEAKARSDKPSRTDLPLSTQTTGTDPLTQPEVYAKFPQAPGVPGNAAPVSHLEPVPDTPVTSTPVTSTPVAAAPVPQQGGRKSLLSWWNGRNANGAEASGAYGAPTAAEATESDLPPGFQSVVAAELGGSVDTRALASRPPAGFTPPVPSVPVGAPNAFTLMMPNGTVGGAPASMMSSAGLAQMSVPSGLSNAFTTPTTSRPTPAEFDMVTYHPRALDGANGFQNGGGMGGAWARPPMMANAGYYHPQQQQYAPQVTPVSYNAPVAMTGALLSVLHDAMLPSDRELAARELSKCDWRTAPEAVQGLMCAALRDPAASVRAGCVQALGKMKVNTLPVVQTVTALKTDKDVRVRQAAEQTLAVLTGQQ
jgi:hypothetical protein